MISPDPMVEPIVPMGPLAEVLGCEIAWKDGKLSIRHPLRGDLKVSQHNGCPQVSRQLALDLISELEDANQGLKRGLEMSDEFEWLQAMVKAHPVLAQLPDHIKERLAVQPGMVFLAIGDGGGLCKEMDCFYISTLEKIQASRLERPGNSVGEKKEFC